METTKKYKLVKGEETFKLVPRYVPTGLPADYSNKKAQAIITKEMKSMAWEVKRSEAGRSTLVMGERTGEAHRAYSKSTFPEYVQKAGINGTKDFLKVLSQGKGLRYGRIKSEAIQRLEKGFMNEHGYDEPNKKFLVASKQLHDNKNVVFRRIGGRIIPMRIPYEKRADLVPF